MIPALYQALLVIYPWESASEIQSIKEPVATHGLLSKLFKLCLGGGRRNALVAQIIRSEPA